MEEKVALVHSGGGRFGAHQVGATQRLYELGVKPKIFSGTSVGGYNCGFLAQYDHEREAMSAVADLANKWKSINTQNVWKQHFPFGVLQGAWSLSIYDSKPMRDLIYKWFDPSKVMAAGNEFFMGVTSLETGKYHLLSANHPNPREALAASAAAPIFYEPRKVHIPGLGMQLCVDGGIIRATPLRAAFAAGATRIYVCLTEANNMTFQREFNNVKDIGARTLAIMTHNIFILDLKLALLENTLAKNDLGGKRFVDIVVIKPPQPLEGDHMDFDPKRTAELIQQGYDDAKNIVG